MKGDNVTAKAGLSKKIPLIVLSAIVACVAIFTVLWALQDNLGSRVDSSQKKVEASDEETLRELLLKDANLLIQVDEDIEVEEGFEVNGIKELIGEGELRMALSSEWGQAILKVSDGTKLTMNGLTLNGNYVSDGIHMGLDTTLTYLKGTVKLTDSYGIWVKGNAVIEDIDIEKAEYIGFYAERGSSIDIKGGTLTDVATNDVYVDEGATVNISGKVVMQGCMGNSILNYGTVDVKGGTFKDITSYGFNNYGTLTLKGAECTNVSMGVVCTRKGATTDITDLYVHDTVRQGVVTVGGKTTIKDSKFEKTGYHAIEIQTGEAIVENVTVKASKNAGLEAYTDAVVSVKNFTAEGCTGIGIASRGAKITGSDIKIIESGKYGISCGNSANGKGNVEVSNVVVTKPTRSAFYAYSDGIMKLTDVTATEGKYAGIYVAKGAECSLLGNSIIEKMGQRGVEVRGRFHMKGGEIRDCVSKESGAGVYVTNEGVFAMTGGSIHGNVGGEKKRGGGICVTEKGIATIDGGKVYNNNGYYGGGLYVNAKGTVYLKSGSITDNKAVEYGNGICISSKEATVKLSEPFYLAKNDVKLAHKEAMLQLTGSGLSKHSKSEPLLITPLETATEGHKLAACKNATTAKAMNVKVASGDGSYCITTIDRYLTTGYTAADMNMADADTVNVSNFAELKAAVKGTTAKRIIVLKANITIEEQLRLPGGTTIKITDDGTKRILTRANGYLGNLVKTNYGTGLYLTATTPGNLVLDGSVSNPENKEVKSLVEVRGSTRLQGVVLQNNVSTSEKDVRGALVRQWYGDIEIYDSTLQNAKSYSGGAVCIDKGKAYVEGSTFANNESIKFAGGAIRTGANTELKVVDTTFTNNKAASAGGAIVAVSGADVTITDATFVNNISVTTGGAVSINSGANAVVKNTTFTKNTANSDGGAIYVDKSSEVKASGSTFTENKATKNDNGTVKYGNGGAIHCKGTFTDESSSFTGNVARNGGAIAVMSDDAKTNPSKGKVVLNGNGLFKNNVATGNTNSRGGAIFVHSNKCSLEVTGYTFDGNTAANGGAIGGAAGSVIKVADATLKNNKTVAFDAKSSDNKGGAAIYAKGKLDVTNTTFESNQTDLSGGAIYADNDSVVTLKNQTTFKSNVGKSNGGAIFVASEAVVESATSVFDENSTDTTKTGGANGGAVLTWGTFKDTDSTYTNNTGRNGGAIGVQGGKTTLKGKNATASLGKNNATVAGGALYVAAKANVEIANYTFNENKALNATRGGAIYMVKGSNVEIADATFTKNTAKEGGAIYCLGNLKAEKTVFTENTTTGQGGALYVRDTAAGKEVLLTECEFSNNKAETGGGAILIQKADSAVSGSTKGIVKSVECKFNGNTSIDKNNAYQNGGAVLNYGTYIDEASTYTGNIAKNGGAIITQSGGTATLDGKGTGKFSGNESKADALSHAIYANGTVTVKGYKFEGDTTQTIRAVGTLNFDDIADTTIIQGASGKINVVGTKNADKVTITPNKYEIGFVVLKKTDDVTAEEFESVCAAVKVTVDENGVTWTLDKDGKLQKKEALIMVSEQPMYFDSLKDAIAYANTNGGTGDTADVAITMINNAAVTETFTISKNMQIINREGATIKIVRDVNYDYMFDVVYPAKFTFGSNEGTGKLIADGNKANSKTGRFVKNTGTFTLGKNASLENGKSPSRGVAIVNYNRVNLYGSILNNETTATNGGMILQGNTTNKDYTDKNLVIYEGTYSGNTSEGNGALITIQDKNSGNVEIKAGTFSKNIASLCGGVLYVVSGPTVKITGGTFSENKAGTGGAIGIEESGKVTCDNAIFDKNVATGNGGAVWVKGTFEGKNNKFTKNQGKKGGAIIVFKGGSVELTGVDTNAVFSGNVATVGGTGTDKDGHALYIQSGSTATVKKYSFSEKVFVGGTLKHKDLTGLDVTGSGTVTPLTE